MMGSAVVGKLAAQTLKAELIKLYLGEAAPNIGFHDLLMMAYLPAICLCSNKLKKIN